MAQCRRQVAVTRQHADLAEAVYLQIKVVNQPGPTNIRATQVLPEATETKDWTLKETAQGLENVWYCFSIHSTNGFYFICLPSTYYKSIST